MKIISIAAVSGGGKTTIVNALKKKLGDINTLYFDDYTFESEVENFNNWVLEGADYNVWNLEPLIKDIEKIIIEDKCDLLILDYPFAYLNDKIKGYIDFSIFIDTPLDIALARRILRDFKNSSASEIRKELQIYLNFARIAFTQMQKDVLPSSDLVIDGSKSIEEIVDEIILNFYSI
ncbi:AAA family ATPase [Floricoccus tropicus]|nr:AAA family ATPase [Floricoccus tropicus]